LGFLIFNLPIEEFLFSITIPLIAASITLIVKYNYKKWIQYVWRVIVFNFKYYFRPTGYYHRMVIFLQYVEGSL
jgi:hypothetical protein